MLVFLEALIYNQHEIKKVKLSKFGMDNFNGWWQCGGDGPARDGVGG